MTFIVSTTGAGSVTISEEYTDPNGAPGLAVLTLTPAEASAVAIQLPMFAALAREEGP